jgi:hypothetical protein
MLSRGRECVYLGSLKDWGCFSVLGKKNKKMKGKTFGLTEFLADGASGPGAGQTVITRKSTNWADDVENEDGRH